MHRNSAVWFAALYERTDRQTYSSQYFAPLTRAKLLRTTHSWPTCFTVNKCIGPRTVGTIRTLSALRHPLNDGLVWSWRACHRLGQGATNATQQGGIPCRQTDRQTSHMARCVTFAVARIPTVDVLEIGEILHIFPSGTESMGDRGSKKASWVDQIWL